MSVVEDIKKIYDTDFVCEYRNFDTDTKYREEFLRAFRMSEFKEDEIINKQMSLLSKIKNERKFLRLAQNAANRASVVVMDPTKSEDCDFGIMMLFSFDYFDGFHKCLSNYVNNDTRITPEFIEDYNRLLKLLETE